MKFPTSLLALTLVLYGCASPSPYRVPPSTPTAELSVMATATPGATTSRLVRILAFAEGQCAPSPNGEWVENEFKTGHPETVSTSPKPISASGPFHLVAIYSDSRFAQNRGCAVEAQFQPVPGRKYKGVIVINDDVASCDFALYDVTLGKEELAQFEMPPTMCPIYGQPARPNGRALRTDWKVHVQTVPAK